MAKCCTGWSWDLLRRSLRNTLKENAVRWTVGFVLLFSLIRIFGTVEENYPFSHFPMYGNPNGDEVDYLFLTDSTGQPIAVTRFTGETAAKLKKKWNSALKVLRKGTPKPETEGADGAPEDAGETEKPKDETRGLRDSELPEALQCEAAARVLEESRKLAEQRQTPLPPGTRVMLGLIENTDKGFREKFRVLAELPNP